MAKRKRTDNTMTKKDRQYNGQRKNRQYNGQNEEGQTIQWSKEEGQTIQWPKEKGQTTFYKTLHRKLKIELQHEPH
jgi:hypothetical protein